MSNHITYDSDDGREKLCMTRDKCPSKGYELRIQCLTQKQCEARGYYQIDDETHTCIQISTCKEGLYNMSKTCFSRAYCIFNIDPYVVDGRACVTRDKWLNLDPRNFVDLNMEAQIYTEEVNEMSDASTICRTKDGSAVEGVRLYRGKLCMCPDSAPYFDQNDQKCKTGQQVNSEGNLRRDMSLMFDF